MRLNKIIFFGTFLMYILGCTNKSNKKSIIKNNQLTDSVYNDNLNANEYLKKLSVIYQYSDTIIILPTIGCGGCYENTLKWLSVSKNRSKNYTVIIDSNQPNNFVKYPFYNNIIFDKKNLMSNYRFGIGYPHMLIVNSSSISIIPYSIYDSNVFDLK